MRVNVIVPCHNAAPYIGEALESVLRQSHAHTTAIVVDDGSTDATGAIAQSFGPRITVIRQPQSGVSAARNRALAAADGEYIAFLDADDRWHPEKVSRQLAYLAAHPRCGLVHTAVRYIDADGAAATTYPNDEACRRETRGECFELLLARNTIITSSVLLRRDILREERFLEGLHAAEDWDLWLRIASHTPMGFVDSELTDYRLHAGNATKLEELMLRGGTRVIERALARGLTLEQRTLVVPQMRWNALALAHLAYEREEMKEARQLFRQAFPTVDADAVVQYLAASLPRFVRQPARHWWRRLRATGDRQNAEVPQ